LRTLRDMLPECSPTTSLRSGAGLEATEDGSLKSA
jgi:hypothetical protein